MKRLSCLLVALLLMPIALTAQTNSDAVEIERLLNQFLAATTDPATHERFWADDLIYTRSAGRRVSKAEVLRDVRSAPAPKPDDPKTVYTAEDLRINVYGDMAIVAFRLVGTTTTKDGPQVQKFLNSGTFLKRTAKWQVVNWQATRIPDAEADSKTKISAAEAEFVKALLAADANKVASLTHPSFVWTHPDGQLVTRQDLVTALSDGKIKYAKLESSKVTVNVYGDSAVVRGESLRQRSAIPNRPGPGDPAPFTAYFTMTFINAGGSWRVVAMHTSRAN